MEFRTVAGFMLKIPGVQRPGGPTEKKDDGASGTERRIMTPDSYQPDENAENRFTVRSALASLARLELTF
ncbi:unnamed protein product [Lasius platythorax]|uniref:Uncharacterized protein n=1 Tax=Lasius platythorax TaxID=488582 RepID=A0AAV2NAP4_9HYME